MTLAIVGATVIPLDSERALPEQTVLIAGDRIARVGPSGSVPVPSGARVVDGKGKFVIPGLADMHVHLAREEDLGLFAARGVTTVRNMWGAPLHVAWRERIRKGEIVGPEIYTAGPILDGEQPVHDGSLVLRDPGEVDAAIALHKRVGYDFVKVYSKLPAAVLDRILASARAAGYPVAGHVPSATTLSHGLTSGPFVVEHLTGFLDEIQADGSPHRGKRDRASRQAQIDSVDEAKIPPLAKLFQARGGWSCPTLGIIEERTAAEAREALSRPEMKYVPPFVLATWQPRGDPPAEEVDRMRRRNALNRRLVKALHDAGARLVAGTDTENPLLVPGYSLIEELARLVGAGLRPYEALRAATHDAAEMMGREAESGTVAGGKRADLVVLDADPLADVSNAGKVAGVILRGRYLGPDDLAAILRRSERAYRDGGDPMESVPAMPGFTGPLGPGVASRDLAATFEVLWKGVRFGGERVLVERGASGERTITAQSLDPYMGQVTELRLTVGSSGEVLRVVVSGDGAVGRGRADRDLGAAGAGPGRARAKGTYLSGVDFDVSVDVPAGVALGSETFLAPKMLLAPRLLGLGAGQSVEVAAQDIAFGSTLELRDAAATITRAAAASQAGSGAAAAEGVRFGIAPKDGPPATLWLDDKGSPVAYEIEAYGAIVRYQRWIGR